MHGAHVKFDHQALMIAMQHWKFLQKGKEFLLIFSLLQSLRHGSKRAQPHICIGEFVQRELRTIEVRELHCLPTVSLPRCRTHASSQFCGSQTQNHIMESCIHLQLALELTQVAMHAPVVHTMF